MTLGVQHSVFRKLREGQSTTFGDLGYAHFFIWTGRLEAAFGLMETFAELATKLVTARLFETAGVCELCKATSR